MESKQTNEALLRGLSYYHDKPVEFAQDFYCDYHPTIEKLDKNQSDLLKAIFFNKATSAKSGTGTGKTSALALAASCYLLTRPLSMVVVTGPKFDQIKDTFWNEFQRWQLYSPLGRYFHIGSDKIQPIFAKQLFGKSADMWAITARTCREPQGLAGLHADDSLFICDEASAIDDLIYEVIEGNLTKTRNKIVLTGQPAKINGYYFDSQNKDKDQWKCLHFDSEKSEIADPAYCARMKKKYGENSDVYIVRVKGDFPSGNPKAMMQYSEVMAAVHREIPANEIKGPFELGVDVARYGDDLTCIAVRRANKLYPLQTYAKLDTVQVAARVIQTVRDYRETTGYSGLVKIKVDDTGVGGGVTDQLRRSKEDKILVVPVNFGASPKDGVHANMASKLWKGFADVLKYVELPNDDTLVEELSSRRKAPHASGLVMIESKDRYKADYHTSPDRADAVVLAFGQGAEAKKVWPAFHPWNTKQCLNFTLSWKKLLRRKAQPYGTIYQEKDMTTNLLTCLWDGQFGKLYVFQEVVSLDARPENIIPRLKQSVEPQFIEQDVRLNLSKFLWYANPEMFGMAEKARNMATMREGTALAFQKKEYSIFLQPNLDFDMQGAVGLVGSMIASNMVVVHSNCKETIHQFSEWKIQNGKPATENSGLCLALCNIASMLHQWGKTGKWLPKLPAYSKEKEYSLKQLNEADEAGIITEYEARKRGLVLPERDDPMKPFTI